MYKEVRSIFITAASDPELIRRINLLAKKENLMATSAVRRLLDAMLPREEEEDDDDYYDADLERNNDARKEDNIIKRRKKK